MIDTYKTNNELKFRFMKIYISITTSLPASNYLYLYKQGVFKKNENF